MLPPDPLPAFPQQYAPPEPYREAPAPPPPTFIANVPESKGVRTVKKPDEPPVPP